ncbi:uncharacterized protein [Phaseolus vulgaris]|uniref:uncharacterized protein n=1 Tax=Phaseolus vulgaris TaxID=3885 RepID=UPI0035CC1798
MAQVLEMMRALQDNVAASRSEQEKMQVELAASQSRNDELNRVNEELRRTLQAQKERAVEERMSMPPSPPRAFPMPFSPEIMKTVVPPNLVGVKASFTGVEDPEAHLKAFHTQMMLSGGSDAVYCKMFMCTLSGIAMEWFVSLPEGHITSFHQFSKLFTEQYIVSRAPSVVSYDLFDVRQYQGESLKDYLNRFGAQVGVLPGPFSESLIRSHPSTFAEIRRCAVVHIVAETEVSEKRGSAAPPKPRGGQGKQQQQARVHEAKEGKKVQGKPHPYAPRKDQGRGRARENNAPPRYDFMVKLADLIALSAIAARLRVPEKTDKVLGRKKNEWCEFHQAFSHTLHSCLALGHQLAELVKSGFLADYLREAQGDRASGAQAGERQHEIPVHGEMQTIVGGFSGRGCTASQRRRYARSVIVVDSVDEGHFPEVDITFKKADLQDVVPHDNDPVVISLITAGRRVHRVLVEVRGYIELRTTFTDGTTTRTEKIKYLVVNTPSTYNILLGRPTLNRLGAVPSTRHMKLKLPSMEGTVITIKSDQAEARHCYENSLRQKRSICHVTSTPPPGVLEERSVVRGTHGDQEMEDATLGGSQVAQVEAEEEGMITPRESGIARAVIASERRPHPAEGWVEVNIRGKRFKLGGSLCEEERRLIAGVIEKHMGAFAWSASDMPGIDPDFRCHRLSMDPKVRPVRQRRRKFNEERRNSMKSVESKLIQRSAQQSRR